jgi:hypothetical protein
MTKDPKPLQKTAMTFWFLGIVTNLIDTVRQLILNLQFISKNQGTQSENQKVKNLRAANKTLVLNLIKIFGDLMPAG